LSLPIIIWSNNSIPKISDINSKKTLATSEDANLIIMFFTGEKNDDDALQMLKDVQAHYDKKGKYLEIDANVFWRYLLTRKPYKL